MTDLFTPLELPCGATIKNRICKSAMTEGLAEADDDPNERHVTLYRAWAEGGAGVLVTGNVMVDRRFLERPGNVVFDSQTDLDAMRAWATAGSSNDTHLWMQISHPGRQCARTSTNEPLSPSDVGLKLAGMFAKPRALKESEIEEIIERFAETAWGAIDSGFTGVQIHSAHGYLSSQFLSPKTNLRSDQWGGSLENRARFLMRIVEQTRERIGDDVPIAVKLNSADFSKGGFSNEDSAQVASWLSDRKIDLLEVSGGTYEQTAFLDGASDERAASTKSREAYFLEYAEVMRESVDVPLMVTGGFRSRSAMEEALAEGLIDMVGIARPFCVIPDFPNQLERGELDRLPSPEKDVALGSGFFGPGSGNKTMRGLNSQTNTAWFYRQIYRLADGETPDGSLKAWPTLLSHFYRDQTKGLARGRK